VSASQNRPAQRLSWQTRIYMRRSENRSAQRATNRDTDPDLSRSVELLTVDIEHEEARVGVRDLSDPAYPVLAQSLRTRRDNICATIASLKKFIHGTPKAA
jgi:hypothetical protein